MVNAAAIGPPIQGVTGPDRAILYVLVAWTGYRRKELASLKRSSFKLAANPPTVTVTAAYSKRRRRDVIPLHSEVASRLKQWLETKNGLTATQAVFDLHAPEVDCVGPPR